LEGDEETELFMERAHGHYKLLLEVLKSKQSDQQKTTYEKAEKKV
jgi:hypothetical protein